MYRREKPIVLKGSTSALSNNLSVQVNLEKNHINYAIVHKSVVNLVTASTDGSVVNHRQIVCKEPSATQGTSGMVMQARLLPTPTRTLLVITSQKGIQMFEAEGSIMLYWYALGDMTKTEAQTCFGRGICGVNAEIVCVGTHEGSILVFSVPTRGTNITLSETIKGCHPAAVCALEAEKDTVVSSDDLGNVIVWRAGDKFEQLHKISGAGWPCPSVCLWRGIVVAVYGSGHLRVYSAATGQLHAEAAAHAKWINAVTVAPQTGLVLTVGEDSFARLWQLTAGPNPQLEHRHSERVNDQQLQGGAFISDDGRAFGVTGYDSSDLTFYFS